jgi:chitin synthase
MIIANQKYFILFILFNINLILISTFIIYESKWYIYIFILALASILYSFSSLILLIKKICNKNNNNYDIKRLLNPKNYIYIVPCYNESEQELTNTLISLVYQRTVVGDKKSIIIVCDGMVKGKGNNLSTDKILLNILNNKNDPIIYQYMTRENKINKLYIYTGLFNNINYILVIKKENAGKRDSLVLIRRICYNYNLKKYKEYMNIFTNVF